MLENIDFYYFSGTGNTLLVVKAMKSTFEKSGVKVKLHRMEKTDHVKPVKDCVIGLGFPVAAQGTYPFVWSFLKNLPPSDGCKVFMVDTLESFSGGIVGPLKRLLNARGYKTIGAKEIKMPSNLLNKKINEKKNAAKIEKGLREAEKYALQLMKNNSSYKRIPIISDFMSSFSKGRFTWKLFRKFFKIGVNTEKCTKCGLCELLCPVGNIKITEYPDFGNSCEFCMRCISFCPTEAIKITSFGKELKFQRYKAVNAGELLKNHDED